VGVAPIIEQQFIYPLEINLRAFKGSLSAKIMSWSQFSIFQTTSRLKPFGKSQSFFSGEYPM